MDTPMTTQSDPLTSRLVGKLADRDPVTRRNATAALRLNGARAVAAIPALMTLLNDEDVLVRREAERALDCLRTAAATRAARSRTFRPG